MTFREALPACLQNACLKGKQAVKHEHRDSITCGESCRFSSGINLDKALMETHRHDHRWDYGLGLKRTGTIKDEIVWVEIHPASKGDEVLRKLIWLKDWINNEAPRLNQLVKHPVYYWITTGVGVPKHLLRKFHAAGLMTRRKIVLS